MNYFEGNCPKRSFQSRVTQPCKRGNTRTINSQFSNRASFFQLRERQFEKQWHYYQMKRYAQILRMQQEMQQPSAQQLV